MTIKQCINERGWDKNIDSIPSNNFMFAGVVSEIRGKLDRLPFVVSAFDINELERPHLILYDNEIDNITQSCRSMLVRVAFKNDDTLDKTYFLINTFDIDELERVFQKDCEKKNIPNNTVVNIAVEKVYEKDKKYIWKRNYPRCNTEFPVLIAVIICVVIAIISIINS